MKYFITLFFFFICVSVSICQNLVPNPSFEKYNRRPSAMLDEGLEFTRAVPGWVSPNRASTDFITARFRSSKVKVIPPHSGQNMAGAVVQGGHWAEYLSTKLTEPLEVGKKYYVEFWISAPTSYNKINTGTPNFNDHFGMLFDKRLYFTNTKIIEDKRPQVIAHEGTKLIPNEWTKINGSFIAQEAATHIYIGQFLDKNDPDKMMKNYYFVDDIFVEKINKEAEQFEPSKTYQIRGKIASIVMENIYFETDKYELLPESFTELNKLVKIMKDNPTMTINIQGHTDSEGGADYNKTLSENRANSVHDYLIEQGIEKRRLTYAGYGLSKPVAENTTSTGRQKNRRVEFVTKSQDTVGQGVILTDLAYSFSQNIKADAIRLANIGKDERHWDCFTVISPEENTSPTAQNQLKSFSQYKPLDARETVLNQTKENQVVHFQTNPLFPEQQLFILEMLEEFYQQGFTHIGFPDLKKVEQIKTLGYPTLENGKIFQQSIYGDLIRQAQALGFEFFNMTPSENESQKALNILKKQRFPFQGQSKKEAAQKWAMAMNLNRLLKKNGNAKVLLLSPQNLDKKSGAPSNVEKWFSKFYGKDILNISQSPSFFPCIETQPALLRKIKIKRPTIFQKRQQYLLPLSENGNGESSPTHDLHIYHPKNSFPNNRPAYLVANGRRKSYSLNIDKFKMSYPCLVLAYKKGEDINKAIPIDVIELANNQDSTPLILSSGSYEIVLRDKVKRKKMEVEVK